MKQFRQSCFYRYIPDNVDPAIKRLFAEMAAQRVAQGDVAQRAGLGVHTMSEWKKRRSAKLANVRAALNVLGLDLKVVPMRSNNDSEKESES